MALLIPPTKRHFYEMLELIKRSNPDYYPQKVHKEDKEKLKMLKEIELMVE